MLSLTSVRDCPNIEKELGIQHLHVPIEDLPFEDILPCLEALSSWIENALKPKDGFGANGELRVVGKTLDILMKEAESTRMFRAKITHKVNQEFWSIVYRVYHVVVPSLLHTLCDIAHKITTLLWRLLRSIAL